MTWAGDTEAYVNRQMAHFAVAAVSFAKQEAITVVELLRKVAAIENPVAVVGATARLSDDKREGAGNVRQITDILIWAVTHRLAISDFYVDTDRGASRFATRVRERYEDLHASLVAGELDGLVAYNLDRVWRRPREAEALMERVLEGKVTLWSTQGLTVHDADTVFQARMLIGLAANESEAISRRTKRAMETAASRGVPHGGAVPFGRRRERDHTGRMAGPWMVEENEAAVIREVASRVLDGEALSAIAADLNRRQVPTRRGGAWRHTTVRSIVTAAHVAGMRERTPTEVVEGKRIARGDTTLVPAPLLEPIVDESTWRRVRATLADPSRTTTALRGGHERRWLCAGYLVCGACGGSLGSKSGRTARGELTHSYACRGCKRVRRNAATVDEFMAAGVIEWLSRVAKAGAVPKVELAQARAALESVRAQRADLQREFQQGRASAAAFTAGFDALSEREAKAEAVLSRVERGAPRRFPFDRAQLERLWAAADLSARREMVRAAGVEVVVSPVGRGRHRDRFAGLALRQRDPAARS